MKLILLFVFSVITGYQSWCQGIVLKGKLLDKADESPLASATIRVSAIDDTTVKRSTVTRRDGSFEIPDLRAMSYRVQISFVGYGQLTKTIVLNAGNADMGTIYLWKDATVLKDVIIRTTIPPTTQKGDTIQYNASQFKVYPDANVEDLVKKMPGITVDNKGAVTAHGESVQKITIDGREFFGDDATAALRNLPAEIVDKIQVFDRLSDQAQFTGFDDGNTTKAINIISHADMRNGQFGRIYAGYGTDDRYSAGGNVSFFKGDRRISLVGLTNNINQQNFSTQDLLGVTSSQNRGGGRGYRGGGGNRGGGGGGPQGNFGSSNNFLVGNQDGISKTNSFGINFSDIWAKKLTFTGSYFYNNSNTANDQLLNRQYFLTGDSSQFYKETSLSQNKNYNHRVNMRIDYKIDSFNSILITPTLSFQNNNSIDNTIGANSYNPSDLISQSINQNTASTSGYSLNNNILYRHSFHKRGRTISFGLNTGLNRKDGTNYLEAINQYYKVGTGLDDTLKQFTDQFNNGYQVSANVVYTEPVGKQSQLQLNYNPSFSGSKADQETFHYDFGDAKYSLFDSSLSNKFDNQYNRQVGGVSFRHGNRDKMFSAGLSYQYASLASEGVFPFPTSINKSFSNILPNAMLRLKLSAKSNLRLFYRASTSPPSISQLQNVISNTNPLLLSTGNPDLQQQYTHLVSTRYSYTNTLKSTSFFANVFMQTTHDYVGNATYIAQSDSVLTPTITLYKGSQLAKPVNLNGYLNLRSFFTFGMPLKFIRSNLNWNAGFSYVKSPGIINNTANVSNSYTYSGGAVLASNISEYVDFTLSYSGNFNVVKNSIQPQLNDNYFMQSTGMVINLLTKKGWLFQNSLTNQYYKGLTDGFNQNYWLWNISAGKKFLKDQKGDLRLTIFDLLKQNRSITRNATDTYVEDVQNTVLRQYFMLTFTYKLKNFVKK